AEFIRNPDAPLRDPVVHRTHKLDDAMRAMVASADTFFIASAYTEDDADSACAHGVDVSHRGGKPGFVRIDDARTLTVPDFMGNFLFNTIGNLLVHQQAGLLFVDFASGDVLQISADAEVIWAGEEVKTFTGAQRLLRFHITSALRIRDALPLRWGDAELSPVLETTGSWSA